jgi:membrane protein YqaA with SNARE-associated domain
VINWIIGRGIVRFRDRRWFPLTPEQYARAETTFNRYGRWSLLFSWVPIVGDPLTLIAGALRVRFWPFLILVTLGKAARYAVLAAGLAHWTQ